jgi:hypothetical protein
MYQMLDGRSASSENEAWGRFARPGLWPNSTRELRNDSNSHELRLEPRVRDFSGGRTWWTLSLGRHDGPCLLKYVVCDIQLGLD